MALIECPNCNNNISDKATACPKCGEELAKFNTTDKVELQSVLAQIAAEESQPASSDRGEVEWEPPVDEAFKWDVELALKVGAIALIAFFITAFFKSVAYEGLSLGYIKDFADLDEWKAMYALGDLSIIRGLKTFIEFFFLTYFYTAFIRFRKHQKLDYLGFIVFLLVLPILGGIAEDFSLSWNWNVLFVGIAFIYYLTKSPFWKAFTIFFFIAYSAHYMLDAYQEYMDVFERSLSARQADKLPMAAALIPVGFDSLVKMAFLVYPLYVGYRYILPGRLAYSDNKNALEIDEK